jgi:hypothetical protein
MSKELDAALETLTTTYQSLAQAAVGYRETLDAKEINTRLAKAKPDTAEYVALQHLSVLMQTPIVEPAAPTPAPEPTAE